MQHSTPSLNKNCKGPYLFDNRVISKKNKIFLFLTPKKKKFIGIMETSILSVVNTQHKTTNNNILSGNIHPNGWYKKFTNKRGTPDLALISVLAEIVYWYRPKKSQDNTTGISTNSYKSKFTGDIWQTSYEHFWRKFGFHREKLRRIFIKLEQMGICFREFRNISIKGQVYNNRLFIHLSSEFLSSCIDKNNIPSNRFEPCFFSLKKEGGSPRFRGDYTKNNIKTRSIESNINQKQPIKEITSFEKNKTQENLITRIKLNKQISIKTKTLKDFYPLTKNDCQKLQSISGRAFSLNSMNEILLDMSSRLTDRYFSTKKEFLNYMGKAFLYEKRDPAKINNDNFKIKNTLEKVINNSEREKYLSKIEKNKEVSPEWQFKRKLVTRIEPQKAYDLLKAYRSIKIKNNTFYLYLSKNVKVSTSEKEIILEELRFIYERTCFANGKNFYIEQLKINVLQESNVKQLTNQNKINKTIIPENIWGKIRENLITIYGPATDYNWFSKLEYYINESQRTITLKASSIFIKDWIEENYFYTIERLMKDFQYQVIF